MCSAIIHPFSQGVILIKLNNYQIQALLIITNRFFGCVRSVGVSGKDHTWFRIYFFQLLMFERYQYQNQRTVTWYMYISTKNMSFEPRHLKFFLSDVNNKCTISFSTAHIDKSSLLLS